MREHGRLTRLRVSKGESLGQGFAGGGRLSSNETRRLAERKGFVNDPVIVSVFDPFEGRKGGEGRRGLCIYKYVYLVGSGG